MNRRKQNLSLGPVVKQIRKKRKMTQNDIADHIEGYDNGGLSRFERGEQGISEDKLHQVAQLLGVSIGALYHIAESPAPLSDEALDYLLRTPNNSDYLNIPSFGMPPQSPQAEQIRPAKSVPLISWVQAGGWADVGHICDPRDENIEWRDTTADTGPRAFALKVEGDSMTSPYGLSIPEGAIVIIDPDKQAHNKNIVVAMLEGSDHATLKRLIMDGPFQYLKPLNQSYDAIKIDENCKIVGVAVKAEIDL